MNMLNKLFVLMITVIIGLGFIQYSCSDENEVAKQLRKDIIGKWQSLEKKFFTLEFSSDGKVTSQHDFNSVKMGSKSKAIFIDDHHLLGVWDENPHVYEVHIYKTKMILKDPEGKEIEFRRVK